MVDPGVCNRGLLLTCIAVQISMSRNGVGGGDLGLAGVPCWDLGGVSASIPTLGAGAGCEIHSSSQPQMDSSCSWSDSSSSGERGHEATETGLAYAPVSQAHGHNHIVQCLLAALQRRPVLYHTRWLLTGERGGGGGGWG